MDIKSNNIFFKSKNKPRTVLEKYELLKKKNPVLEEFKNTFDLDITL